MPREAEQPMNRTTAQLTVTMRRGLRGLACTRVQTRTRSSVRCASSPGKSPSARAVRTRANWENAEREASAFSRAFAAAFSALAKLAPVASSSPSAKEVLRSEKLVYATATEAAAETVDGAAGSLGGARIVSVGRCVRPRAVVWAHGAAPRACAAIDVPEVGPHYGVGLRPYLIGELGVAPAPCITHVARALRWLRAQPSLIAPRVLPSSAEQKRRQLITAAVRGDAIESTTENPRRDAEFHAAAEALFGELELTFKADMAGRGAKPSGENDPPESLIVADTQLRQLLASVPWPVEIGRHIATTRAHERRGWVGRFGLVPSRDVVPSRGEADGAGDDSDSSDDDTVERKGTAFVPFIDDEDDLAAAVFDVEPLPTPALNEALSDAAHLLLLGAVDAETERRAATTWRWRPAAVTRDDGDGADGQAARCEPFSPVRVDVGMLERAAPRVLCAATNVQVLATLSACVTRAIRALGAPRALPARWKRVFATAVDYACGVDRGGARASIVARVVERVELSSRESVSHADDSSLIARERDAKFLVSLSKGSGDVPCVLISSCAWAECARDVNAKSALLADAAWALATRMQAAEAQGDDETGDRVAVSSSTRSLEYLADITAAVDDDDYDDDNDENMDDLSSVPPADSSVPSQSLVVAPDATVSNCTVASPACLSPTNCNAGKIVEGSVIAPPPATTARTAPPRPAAPPRTQEVPSVYVVIGPSGVVRSVHRSESTAQGACKDSDSGELRIARADLVP